MVMDTEEPLDDELAVYADYGLDVKRIDGVPHADWDGRWLPIDIEEEPPRPKRTTLITATYDPGPGFMSDEAYYELGKVDDSTIVSIARIDGAPIEISFWDFEPGTEEAQIEAFIRQMRELEPDVESYDEDDDDAPGDERHVTFFRP